MIDPKTQLPVGETGASRFLRRKLEERRDLVTALNWILAKAGVLLDPKVQRRLFVTWIIGSAMSGVLAAAYGRLLRAYSPSAPDFHSGETLRATIALGAGRYPTHSSPFFITPLEHGIWVVISLPAWFLILSLGACGICLVWRRLAAWRRQALNLFRGQ